MCISYTKFAIFLSFAFYSCTCSMGEVPGYGSNQSYSCWSQPQQWGIQAMSMTCTRAHGNAGSLTHLVRPGINPASSWIPVRFVSTVPQQELLGFAIFHITLSLPQSVQWCCGVISLDTDTFPGFPSQSPVLDPIPTSATPLSTLLSAVSCSRPHRTAANILYMDETSQ